MNSGHELETDWHRVWRGRVRRFRFWRIPLVLALITTSAHAVSVSFTRLGSTSSTTTPGDTAGENRVKGQATPLDRVVDFVADSEIQATKELGEEQPGEHGVPQTDDLAAADGEQKRRHDSPRLDTGSAEMVPRYPEGACEDELSARPEIANEPLNSRRVLLALKQTAENCVTQGESMLSDIVADSRESATNVIDWLALQEASASAEAQARTWSQSENLAQQQHLASIDSADGSKRLAEQGKVVVINPAATGAVIHFLADGSVHSLNPGQSHVLRCEGPCLIQFHRGADFGDAGHTLAPGTYAYRITPGGWDLREVPTDDR